MTAAGPAGFLPVVAALTGRRPSPPAIDHHGPWIHVGGAGGPMPPQGWKLHVSATPASAANVLARAVPLLLAEGVAFKVAESPAALETLNEGAGGLSQVGKFLTAYPASSAVAVRLAGALDRATSGLRGPAVPSDRPVRPGSLVHYRFGGFAPLTVQTPTGRVHPAVRAADGTLLPDRRSAPCGTPHGDDPFVAAGLSRPVARRRMVAGRFLVLRSLHRTARGVIQVAVDLETRRRCILKRAYRDVRVGPGGDDARDHLRREAAFLARLGPDHRFPEPWDLVEDDGDLVLVMERLEGRTVLATVAGGVRSGRLLPAGQVVRWGRELAAALATVHRAGVVHRDVNSANVLVGPDGRLGLVDFEYAHDLADPRPPGGAGTPGYRSPQQEAGAPASVADDIHALGGVLYLLATGAEPFLAPRPGALLDRPVALLNPAAGPGLRRVIRGCLDPDPAERWSSAAAVGSALAVLDDLQRQPPVFGGWKGPGDDSGRPYRRLAAELADSLAWWLGSQPVLTGDPGVAPEVAASLDLGSGRAGIVLALADLADEFAVPSLRAVVSAEAAGIAALGCPAPAGPVLPGLYVGAAGPAAALLRAGQVLGDPDLVAAAAARSRLVAALPYGSPDLFGGTAGRLRFHLLMWDETGDADHLHFARHAGAALLGGATPAGSGLCWPIPPGFEDQSGHAYLGYAHGAAGIGDALLDLYAATGHDPFREAAAGAGRWLAATATATLDDGSGLGWPVTAGGEAAGALWCHGAAGISRFLFHAAEHDAFPGALDLAGRAARSVARAARYVGPGQCHGLAGGIEALLDAHRLTGDADYRNEAESLAALLTAFVDPVEGHTWIATPAPLPDAGYLLGVAGVSACLLRLAAGPARPHQLSRAGFRYRSSIPVEAR